MRFTIVIPCLNERDSIRETLDSIQQLSLDPQCFGVIVVDDGSSDGTGEILTEAAQRDPRIEVIRHARNRGYGASLKTGIEAAGSEWIVLSDADGTYPLERLPDLLERVPAADMVVGARTGASVHIPWLRRLPKRILRSYASWLTGVRIPDLNSGFRVLRRSLVESLWRVLPDGFSFTTSVTVAALRRGQRVEFVPIDYAKRTGKSKIRPIRDTIGFFQLLVRLGMYFAPLRMLAPLIMICLGGFLASLAYDVFVLEDLTEKTMLFLLAGLNAMLFALLADMIDKRSA